MSRPDPRHGAPGVTAGERRRLQRVLGALTDEDHARVEPPPETWQGVRAALAEEDAASAAVPSGVGPAPVVSLDARRDRRRRLLAGAVAASVALLAGLGALALRDDSDGSDARLVASAELAPLAPGEGAVAAVHLVEVDGHRQIDLDAEGMAPAPAGHHYELWLLAADAEPVSLGAMAGTTTVDVPDGVDLDRYEVVDVSLQAEGQVEHSGDSILRGTLA